MATPTIFPHSRALGLIPMSNTVNAMDFTAAGVKTQNIPTGANLVLIQPASGQDIFVKLNAAATIPGADVTDGSACQQDVPFIHLGGATTISIATNAAGIVTLAYYA
jgi:hypothetical protein